MNISFTNSQLNTKNNVAFKANSVKNAQKAIIDLEISDKIIDSLIIKKQTLDKIDADDVTYGKEDENDVSELENELKVKPDCKDLNEYLEKFNEKGEYKGS